MPRASTQLELPAASPARQQPALYRQPPRSAWCARIVLAATPQPGNPTGLLINGCSTMGRLNSESRQALSSSATHNIQIQVPDLNFQAAIMYARHLSSDHKQQLRTVISALQTKSDPSHPHPTLRTPPSSRNRREDTPNIPRRESHRRRPALPRRTAQQPVTETFDERGGSPEPWRLICLVGTRPVRTMTPTSRCSNPGFGAGRGRSRHPSPAAH
jgi:hypothetical protein